MPSICQQCQQCQQCLLPSSKFDEITYGGVINFSEITLSIDNKCQKCFLSHLESLAKGSPDDVSLGFRLNKEYCDLLLPILDQKRKEDRERKKRDYQAQTSAQVLQSATVDKRRRRLEFDSFDGSNNNQTS